MGEKFCPVCKNKNASDAVICAYCGVPFGSPSQAPVTTVPLETIQPELLLKRSEHLQHLAEYPKDALILYVMAEDKPLVVPGLRPVVLGRAITNIPPGLVDLTAWGAADLGVSRMHAQISYSGAYTIADLASTNGTWLNQTRLVARKPYVLHSGDEVRLGTLSLNVYFHQNEASGLNAEDVILLTEAPRVSGQRSSLTVTYLADVIQPYLAALVDLQNAIDEFQGMQSRGVSLNTISAMRPELPIGISLTGASQAVLLVKNFVVPWRSENVDDLHLYLTGQLPVTAEETSPVTAGTQRVVTTLLAFTEVSQEARQAALANLRNKLPRLAQGGAEHLAVLLAADQKGLADKLLPPLSVLATSRLQMVLVNDKA